MHNSQESPRALWWVEDEAVGFESMALKQKPICQTILCKQKTFIKLTDSLPVSEAWNWSTSYNINTVRAGGITDYPLTFVLADR